MVIVTEGSGLMVVRLSYVGNTLSNSAPNYSLCVRFALYLNRDLALD